MHNKISSGIKTNLKSDFLKKNRFDSWMQHTCIVNKAAWYQLLESTIFGSAAISYHAPYHSCNSANEWHKYGIQMLFLAFWNPHQNCNATCSALTKRDQAVPFASLGYGVYFPGQIHSLSGYWKILLGHHEEKNAITCTSVTTAVLLSFAAMNLFLHLNPPCIFE